MKKYTLLLSLCITCIAAKAQLNQIHDNITYKALYFSQACKLIETTPGLLILDVRSPGEYADTSSSITLNIGHLKGARNLSIDSVEKHLSELEPYKNKPILLYCSHSQRSRVVSNFLGEKGFTQVYSLNGGMSLVNKSTDQEFPLKKKLYTTTTPYRLIESADAYRFIQNKNNLVIDIRPAAQFNGTDTTEANNIGRIRGAVNFPLTDLDAEVSKLSSNRSRAILICNLGGPDAVKAALKFTSAGFKNVNVLFEGLSTFIQNTPSVNQKLYFAVQPKYKVIGPKETITLVKHTPGLIVADVRARAEFENKDKLVYHNLGHITKALNFSPTELDTYLNGKPKTSPILVYGSNMPGQNGLTANEISKRLAQKGYTNVHLFYGGMYGMVWTVTNIEDCKDGWPILTDHKGLY
ncbi:rhodanese-like domain-containing protein [Mucilaginibacter mali]|uniref:Rhodanese-like domain-containing protein n=1 Tax=Mucilaginibacter mali TaxID=2740462 RepID=A0A7D4TV78_9SPHI|nr:rhodanese-like domain-containing protein [Mucilaginibacter mali]QKJ28337.1 rhodanese-like domain-containing protein [Mucilaginibacter mali]